jgi:hypothetical protein
MSYGSQQTPYLARTVDLTTARTFIELVPPGVPIKQVFVAQLPSATAAGLVDFRLRFGNNQPPIPVAQGGGQIFFTPLMDGLYVDNSAQPGTVAVLYISQGAKV